MKDLRCYSWTAPHLWELAIWLIREDTTDMHIHVFVQTHKHIQHIHKHTHGLCNVCLASRTNKHEQVAGWVLPASISKYFTTQETHSFFMLRLHMISYTVIEMDCWDVGINKKGLKCVYIDQICCVINFITIPEGFNKTFTIHFIPSKVVLQLRIFKIMFQLII